VFGLTVSEGALDAMFQRSKNCLDAEVSAILARLRRARVIYSDETGVRVNGKGHWNWVFQNTEVVIHVIRNSRGAGVVDEVMDGHRPVIWVSDLYAAQQGHADAWQVCLAHQLRDCQFAIDAGDAIFAPRMKMLFLRAFALARRKHLADSTRARHHHGALPHEQGGQATAKAVRQGSRSSFYLSPKPRSRPRQ
jgi:transposase